MKHQTALKMNCRVSPARTHVVCATVVLHVHLLFMWCSSFRQPQVRCSVNDSGHPTTMVCSLSEHAFASSIPPGWSDSQTYSDRDATAPHQLGRRRYHRPHSLDGNHAFQTTSRIASDELATQTERFRKRPDFDTPGKRKASNGTRPGVGRKRIRSTRMLADKVVRRHANSRSLCTGPTR